MILLLFLSCLIFSVLDLFLVKNLGENDGL